MQFIDAGAGLDFGRSASPALYEGKLLVSIHHLFALDAKTGKVIWQNPAVLERFGTPLAARLGGVDVALAPSGQIARLQDGKLMFTATELQYASPIAHDATAYFVGTVSSATMFSERTGEPAAEAIWRTELDGSYFASPVFDRGLIFTVSNEGIFRVLNAADGRTLLSKELEIASANGRPGAPSANLYPSLALAGKYLFLSNDAGETLVLEPGKEYREIKRNDLGEGFSGAPIFAGSRMYVRSKDRLYCIGNK
jgi:outer membrane protein assembly factor BamB